MKTLLILLMAYLSFAVADHTNAQSSIATLRQGTPLNEESEDPARLQHAENKDLRRARAYPMQPPTIPHKIDAYQVDLYANKCLSCHARDRAADAQAPMISVTHFMDRDGNFLADVSARRYFCQQCHVTQIDRKPLLENRFTDVKSVLEGTP